MSDGSSKPGIPAWQRTRQQQQPRQPSDTVAPNSQHELKSESADTQHTSPDKPDVVSEKPDGSAEETSTEEPIPPPDDTSALELDQVRAFLDDPAIKDAALGKKQAYLESKGVSEKLISETLESSKTETALKPADFDMFKQQQKPTTQPSPPTQSQTAAAPPIITYPEFLLEAHKPPPLVTPSRVLTATYVAGGLATLVYAANKYILNPMVDALTESRHDFSTHSQSKLDEFNERLSKIVSHVPSSIKEKDGVVPDVEISEVDSITSDPTELYHRDMGTQTSPLPSRRSSDSQIGEVSAAGATNPAAVTRHATALSIIESHLSELTDGIDNSASANKERQDSISDLRHYLDTLMYSSSGISAWSSAEDATVAKSSASEDPIEQLKKEIRGVKGVLLSARRFPSTVGRTGAT